jgi:hypothetical protein
MVCDVPSFLNAKLKPLEASCGFKSIIQHKGYCFNLENYTDIETYIKDRFQSKKSRRVLRSGKKRLETCFDITYKIYFGSIDRDHYDQLFKRFYRLLELRAAEKGIDNRNLKIWEYYLSRVYDMIISKQASLFVIYDDDKAINISLHLHVKNTVFLYIAAYDIDYSKFRLGHTNILMILDWFIKNGIKLVDLSKGNVGYKKQWANIEYDFKYHLFYNSSNIMVKLIALWIAKKLQLKQSLRNKNVNTYYYNTLNWLKTNNKAIKIPKYQLVDHVKLPEKKTIEPVSFREYYDDLFLKRIIYTALYLSFTHVKDLNVYRELENTHIYYLESRKKVQKLMLGK